MSRRRSPLRPHAQGTSACQPAARHCRGLFSPFQVCVARSLLPAPISGWPDLEAFRGRRGLGGCREVIRMGGRRGIRRRRGLGCRRKVIPGLEQSTMPLIRRSPWRVAKWHLRKDDMMALGRPMGGSGRSVGMLRDHTVRILSTRRDENSDECATDEGQEPVHIEAPVRIAAPLRASPNRTITKSR
jgi:hypothetical protein